MQWGELPSSAPPQYRQYEASVRGEVLTDDDDDYRHESSGEGPDSFDLANDDALHSPCFATTTAAAAPPRISPLTLDSLHPTPRPLAHLSLFDEPPDPPSPCPAPHFPRPLTSPAPTIGSSYQGDTPSVSSPGTPGFPFGLLFEGGGNDSLAELREEEPAELGRWEREGVWGGRERREGLGLERREEEGEDGELSKEAESVVEEMEVSGVRKGHGRHPSDATVIGPNERHRSATSPASSSPASESLSTPALRRTLASLSPSPSQPHSSALPSDTPDQAYFTPANSAPPTPPSTCPSLARPPRSSSLRHPAAPAAWAGVAVPRRVGTVAEGGGVDWRAACERERDKAEALEKEVERLKKVVGILMGLPEGEKGRG